MTQTAQPVLGRDLHSMLEVQTAYKDWFPACASTVYRGNGLLLIFERKYRRQTRIQIINSPIDMAKELCMLQRTDKGKQCRQYFLAVGAAME